MKNKTLLAAGGAAVALLMFGSVAIAGGIGPLGAGISASVAVIQNVFKGTEKVPNIDPQTGCDSSATSTNCATVKTSQPAEQATKGLSTATSYTEVASTHQSGKIDARLSVDNTLKTISFCGTAFKTRQVIINGVDVGQRIAYLASNDQMGKMSDGASFGHAVCLGMPHNVSVTKGILEIRDVITPQTNASRAPEARDNYFVWIGLMSFAINPVTNEIFNIDAYDGSLVSVGKLK